MSRAPDVVVLGGGSAGIVAGVALGGLGLRVLLIEKHRLGGECLNTGCVPSKALLASARAADAMRRAAEFGLGTAPPAALSAGGVMDRVRATVERVRDADATEDLLRRNGVEIARGEARFIEPRALSFDGRRLGASQFIVCTGSRPRIERIPGLEHVTALTNHDLFGIGEIPATLLVLGGGPVGVEMAQAFARLGSRVTLVQRGPSILPRDDAELVGELEARLRRDGVDVRTSCSVTRFEAADEESAVAFLRDSGGSETSLRCRHVLTAVGRRANVEGLGLDAAGVECGRAGILVDETLHTTGRGVWACGDVIGRHRFSHMAEYEAKLVARNLFLPTRSRARYPVVPWCTFTDPELAHVGMTEADARRRGIDPLVLRQPFAQDDRALVDEEPAGCVKLIVAPGLGAKLLGAQILGPRAGELIQELVLVIEQGLGVRAVADSVHIYPTLGMAVQHAAQRWYERQAADPGVRRALGAYRAVRPALPLVARGAAAAAATGALWLLSHRRADRAADRASPPPGES